jgi:adenylosuccinate synthase
MIQARGIDLSGRYWISPRCHVVMPYHPLLEGIYEEAKGSARTGTTRRGMGPVYADKVSYNGIRLGDLAEEAVFASKLDVQLKIKNRILAAFGQKTLGFQSVYQETLAQYDQIRSLVREPFGRLQEALYNQEHIVLEGAQATLLDTDWGTYPYSTASNTLAGGACAGLGIAPHWIQRVVGVAKAYTTRVGSGPMPSELFDAAGETLLKAGQEFGTVTGRPRRCGWFDAELVRFSGQLNGFSELALTKLDVLDNLASVKICTGYRHTGAPGDALRYWEGDADWLASVEPLYIELPGWQQPTKSVRHFDELPEAARAYVRTIEELVNVRVSIVSVGPGREEIIPVPPVES